MCYNFCVLSFNAKICMTFFEDFRKLNQKSVHLGLRGFKNINCVYNDYLYFSKDCYMCFVADKFWTCFYCDGGISLKDCYDCSECDRCEVCYSCLNCKDCFDGTYLQDCRRTSQSSFCYDCLGCNSCFGCAGLRQKNYYIFNKQFDEQTYNKEVKEWKIKSIDAIWKELEKVKLKIPHQHAMIYRGENSTGDHLENVQNSIECFSSSNLQDCGHCYRIYTVYGDRNRDTYDCYEGVDLEQCYEGLHFGKGYNCNYCYYTEVLRDCDYCFQVFNSKNCFGCVSVNHGQYMILNQKYEPKEWERKKAEIIEQMKKDGEWGNWPLAEGERFDAD